MSTGGRTPIRDTHQAAADSVKEEGWVTMGCVFSGYYLDLGAKHQLSVLSACKWEGPKASTKILVVICSYL